MKKVLLASVALGLLLSSCSKKSGNDVHTNPPVYKAPVVAAGFAKGADISWVTQMESSGVKFYDKSGAQKDLFALLKSLGFTSIRLRAWVNPSDGWCNTADVVAKAKRAQNAGMKIMIDFHYSDSWADPGKQPKPAAWTGLDFATLVTTLHDYTVATMNTLKTNGITPDWAQVGNEVDDGMLWEDGRASAHMANFAALVEAGYQAVKSVSSTTKVIVHVSNGFDNDLFRYLFDGLKNNGAHWDIIGMSLYPSTTNYTTLDTQCQSNINDMVARYGTPVMLCEIGMQANQPGISRDFLTDIITKVNAISNNNGLGVFYWEPEAYNWQGYGLGAFDNTGKPTIALDAFSN
ncbi:glycoside hydrolase family 53 protein [Mucilaginibacter ginsenosidivorans]|uniref:Arabinogalactan endo-beta-1,4-galactanase n=1 Tax=Mucilaginibacter ginsenosidivorans TaxID=398053 RepID=A0A5B8UYH1_9SPHI|nr:glycosyl hydrolase 53 family protein [Mucilaginibacter ginsenosidivorans]QEC64170.1 cellulase family glycosylhydrolase [Mucilaginibacter ginsenosidivorans]